MDQGNHKKSKELRTGRSVSTACTHTCTTTRVGTTSRVSTNSGGTNCTRQRWQAFSVVYALNFDKRTQRSQVL
eukprot:scaffold192904_cov19-Tisochrysis_lutea.AAC.2